MLSNKRQIFRLQNNHSMKNDISEYLGSIYNEHIVNLDSIALGEVLHAQKGNLANRFDSFKMGPVDQISFQMADNQSNDTYFSYRRRGPQGPEKGPSPNESEKVIYMNRFRPKLKNTTSLNFDKGISHAIGRDISSKSGFSKSIQSGTGLSRFRPLSMADADYDNLLVGGQGSQTFDFSKLGRTEIASIEGSNVRISSEKMERLPIDWKPETSARSKPEAADDADANGEGQSTGDDCERLRKIAQLNWQQLVETVTGNLRLPGTMAQRRKSQEKEGKPRPAVPKQIRGRKQLRSSGKAPHKKNELEVIKELSQVISVAEESRIHAKVSAKSVDFLGNSEPDAADPSLNAILNAYYSKLQKELFHKICKDPFTQGSLNNSDKLLWNSELLTSDWVAASGKNSKFFRFSENREQIMRTRTSQNTKHLSPYQMFHSHERTPQALKSPNNAGAHSKFDLKNQVLESELISNEQFARNRGLAEQDPSQSNLEFGLQGGRNAGQELDGDNWYSTVKRIKSNEIRKAENDFIWNNSALGLQSLVEASSETLRFNEKSFARKLGHPRNPKIVHYIKYETPSKDFHTNSMRKHFNDSFKISSLQSGGTFAVNEAEFSRETSKIAKGEWAKRAPPKTTKTGKEETARKHAKVDLGKRVKYNSQPRNEFGRLLPVDKESGNENGSSRSDYYSLNSINRPSQMGGSGTGGRKMYSIGFWKNHPLMIDARNLGKKGTETSERTKRVVKFIDVLDFENGNLNLNGGEYNNRNLRVRFQQGENYIFQGKSRAKQQKLKRILSVEKTEGYLKRYLQFSSHNKHNYASKPQKRAIQKSKFARSPERRMQTPRSQSGLGDSRLYRNANQKDFIRQNKEMIRELSRSRQKMRRKHKSQNESVSSKRSILSYQIFKDQKKRYKELYLNKKKQKMIVKQSFKMPKPRSEQQKKAPRKQRKFRYKEKIYLNEIDRISANINKFRSLSKKISVKRRREKGM